MMETTKWGTLFSNVYSVKPKLLDLKKQYICLGFSELNERKGLVYKWLSLFSQPAVFSELLATLF